MSAPKSLFRRDVRTLCTVVVVLLLSGVWLWRRAQSLHTFTYPAEVRNLAYSPDGTLLAAIRSKIGQPDLGVIIWDTQTWKPIRILPGDIYWFRFTSDGQHIVTVGQNDQMESVQAKRDEAALKKAHPRWSSSQVQSWLYAHETQAILQCWDAHDNFPPKTVIIPGSGAEGISSDGQWVYFSGPGNQASIWDAATGRKMRTIASAPSPAWAAFSPDNVLVATGDIPQHIDKKGDWNFETGKQGIWNLRTGQRITALDGRAKGVLVVQFSHDGHLLAVETANALMLWDTRSWKLLHNTPTEPIMYNNSLKFSRDDQYLIGGAVSRTQNGNCSRSAIQFWEVGTGKLICERKNEEFERLSSDGRLAASQDDIPGATTYHLHLWDTATGRLITTLPGAAEPTFAPGGKILLTVNTRYDSPSGLQSMGFVPKQTATFNLWAVPQAPSK